MIGNGPLRTPDRQRFDLGQHFSVALFVETVLPRELPEHDSRVTQRQRFWVYEIENGDRQIRFAAGELSPNVWGFYVPAE